MPAAAQKIAGALLDKYPGASIFLYGSGISISASENPTDILYDFYIIAPNYHAAIGNSVERIAAHVMPPNVYYFEALTADGLLRSKYALLSIDAFERLVGSRTFHSYFWARFAQPCRLVSAAPEMKGRLIAAVRQAIVTFLERSQGLAADPKDWHAVWLAGLNASYRAELRAEASDRAEKLIESYGDWPVQTAAFALDPTASRTVRAELAWRLRAALGSFLSIARLLKATTTFNGGIDYIAWKVKRHAGVDVGIKPWERAHPFLAAPIVAARYYRMRAARRAADPSA